MKKDLFKKLIGIERGDKKWRVKDPKTKDSERWVYHILTADQEAPKIEVDKKRAPFLVIGGICFLIFFVMISRIFYLQLMQGDASRQMAEGNRIRANIVRAPRGVIYDRHRVKLVKNVPNYEVAIIPTDLSEDEKDREYVYTQLGKILRMKAVSIKKKVEDKGQGYTQPILIKEKITKNRSFIIESKKLKGVNVSANPVRQYLDEGYLAHVLGYVGRISEEELSTRKDSYRLTDYIGKTGLEKSYEDTLRGKDGSQRYEVDSSGKVIKFLGQEDPVLGRSMILSIDFALQKKLVSEMDRVMATSGARKASAVAMNPKTGEILAFVNLPTYDNNLFSKGISDKSYSTLLKDDRNPLLARAMSGEYPSGSVIKPFVASAALQEGNINENTSVNSTGGIKVGTWKFPDWKYGGHGITNVTKAIAESVNTFFYAIGGGYGGIQGLGPEKMKHYLNLFGFGSTTGVDVGGETSGAIPDPVWKEKVKNESWYLGDTYHMAIGQGDVLVTPLQITNATCAIVNGGKLYKPRFVHSVVDENDKVIDVKKSEVIRKGFISPSNLEIVRRGMRQTVTSGSGRSLNDLSVAIAGKTGTAQFGPNNSLEHGWFTSFAPYENPQIVLTILVEGAGGGDKTAVPIAREVYKWYFSR